MKQDPLDILQSLKSDIDSHIMLGKAERVRIFDAIRSASEGLPANVYAYPSPFSPHVASKRPMRSHVFFMNYASISLAAFLVMAGSLSFAAEKSLPGDALYAVKTNFNENVQGLLTFSSQSKAKLEAKLAENRLVEAQKLAVANNLSKEQEESINESFKKHSEEFARNLSDAGKSVEDPAAIASISADFQSSLLAHKNVISSLENQDGEPLSDEAIDREIASVEALRKGAESKIAGLDPEEAKAAADERGKAADEALARLEALIAPSASTSAAISEGALAAIQEHVLDVHFMIEGGYELFEEGKFSDAYASFQQSIIVIEEAGQTLSAAAEIELSGDKKEAVILQGENASSSVSAILEGASKAAITASSSIEAGL